MSRWRDGDDGRLHARSPRTRRRVLRLPAARRWLGMEQRRADRGRRRIAARRHAVRSRTDRGDARLDDGRHGRLRRSTRWSTPMPTATTATATRSHPSSARGRDRRLVGDRRRDGRCPAVDARRAQPGARRGRRSVPIVLRRVRLRRHRTACRPTRTFDGRLDLDVGGRTRRADRGRARRTPPATRSCTCPTPAWSTPATSCSSVARRSCGPDRCRTGSPRAT